MSHHIPDGWAETPWPIPSAETAHAILEKHGVTVTNDQYTIPQGFIDELTEEENQTLTAFGVFGPLNSPQDNGEAEPDYSLACGVFTESLNGGTEFKASVFENGKVILTETSTNPPDTVALWNKAHEA